MKNTMRHINLIALVCLGVAALAQNVQYDYDRSANFQAYKTYQWVDYREVQVGDQPRGSPKTGQWGTSENRPTELIAGH
jgi:hypothetical protein